MVKQGTEGACVVMDTERTAAQRFFEKKKIFFTVVGIVITELKRKREMWSHNRAIRCLIPFFLLLTEDSMRSDFSPNENMEYLLVPLRLL